MALLRFVNSIQVSPVVRLDLNDRVIWGMGNETTFGMPEMRRAVTSSMLRDGDHVGATAYGNREITLVLELFSLTADAAAAQLQLLQRELDRPTNLLQYTPGNVTNTVFFQTFRASPDAIRFDPTRKQVHVTILAEPFALGLREDLAPITVRNNPTLANGLFADLTGIKGDVDVPLFIEYADGAGGLGRSGFAVGVRNGPGPYPNRFIEANAMSMSGNTSTVADAAFTGGSKARCTFGTQTLFSTRLASYFPNLTVPAGAENWGLFRVFARVAQTVATDVITMSAFGNRSVIIRSQTEPQMVDLGTVDSTNGLATVGGYAPTEYRVGTAGDNLGLSIQAGRTSGSGSLDIDYLAFVPADECLGSWSAFNDVNAATDLGVVDGPNDSAYIATALSGAAPNRSARVNFPTAITGRLPRVAPGSSHLVIVETGKGTFPSANALTSSITMTIRYWPKYLLVRGVGT